MEVVYKTGPPELCTTAQDDGPVPSFLARSALGAAACALYVHNNTRGYKTEESLETRYSLFPSVLEDPLFTACLRTLYASARAMELVWTVARERNARQREKWARERAQWSTNAAPATRLDEPAGPAQDDEWVVVTEDKDAGARP